MRIHGELFAAANAYSVDVSAARLRAHRFVLQAVRNWRIKGGSYGDFNGVDDPGTGDNYGNNKIEEYGGLYPANVIVNKVRIHDLFCVPSNCHAEGLFLWRTRNVTIRNSKFYNNDFYDIFFAGGDDSGTVIENNWFDDPYIPDTDGSTRHPSYGRGTAIQWKFDSASNYSNMLVRFNSFNRQTGLSSGSGSFTRAVGNLMGATDCASADYEYNIFTPASGAQKCGTHAMAVLRFPYMNGGHGPGLNYHIKGGKPVNFVPGWLSGSRIGRDIDGQRRPRGSARDAGSDELK